ncbi:MAG: hypothetical protein AB2535_10025 [Candidatus Thiodiazotropha endolucinida]
MVDSVYTDDETIDNETLLLRRVPSTPKLTIIWDSNLNTWRPSSAAFDNHPNGSPMSIVLSDTLDETERPYESVLQGHEGFSLAAFKARIARENNQGIAREPTTEEPAHGVVFGDKTKSVRKKLAKASNWIVEPDLPNVT